MSLDMEVLRQAVQAEIDIAVNQLTVQQLAPLNVLLAGLLVAVENDEALRVHAIQSIGETLIAAQKADAIDQRGTDYVNMALSMLKRRVVAKEYLQLARVLLDQTKTETPKRHSE